MIVLTKKKLALKKKLNSVNFEQKQQQHKKVNNIPTLQYIYISKSMKIKINYLLRFIILK